jgi:hypothetical protein
MALRSFVALQEAIVEQCQEAGLIWGRELYFDGTKVAANAGKESVKPRFAVEAHLRNLFDTEAEEPVDEEEQQRAQEEPAGSDAPVPLPVSLSPAAYEELALHNEARHDWIEQVGAQDRSVKGHNYQRIADYQVSTTDPDATIMRSKGGVDLGYHTRLSGGWRQSSHHCRSIGDAIGSDGQSTYARLTLAYPFSLETLAASGHRRQEVRFGRKSGCHPATRAYMPTFPFPMWITVPSSSVVRRSPMTPSAMSTSVQQAKNSTSLPGIRPSDNCATLAYAKDCNHCPLKPKCTTSKQGRSLCRSVDEEILERVRAYQPTEPYKKALRKRQVWVEPLFAEGKDWHGMRRFRLRRLWRVNCEALMRAAGQNLKRLLKKRGWGRHPFPIEALCASFLAAYGWITPHYVVRCLCVRIFAQLAL